ncbi:MAG: DUF4259 domain-containing protein [Xanthomonadaceae bacterium]|jgi:hypothetical protein|nr:DUF4259 domain-containing protein [Xanthomonadaceae bacterium]
MGTWGAGNFDNDNAADHLIGICMPLLEQIEEAMANRSQLEPDEPEADIVTANIEIICCLAEYFGYFPGMLPAEDTIEEWAREYLQIWDDNIDSLDPDPDYRIGRREVIAGTFDKLLQLARRQNADRR